jgi:hypothetical protein
MTITRSNVELRRQCLGRMMKKVVVETTPQFIYDSRNPVQLICRHGAPSRRSNIDNANRAHVADIA